MLSCGVAIEFVDPALALFGTVCLLARATSGTKKDIYIHVLHVKRIQ